MRIDVITLFPDFIAQCAESAHGQVARRSVKFAGSEILEPAGFHD